MFQAHEIESKFALVMEMSTSPSSQPWDKGEDRTVAHHRVQLVTTPASLVEMAIIVGIGELGQASQLHHIWERHYISTKE